MSYCRVCDDSDVYVYFNGKNFIINVSNMQDKEKLGLELETIQAATHKNCINKLNELSNIGYKVPIRALNRLNKEMNNGAYDA